MARNPLILLTFAALVLGAAGCDSTTEDPGACLPPEVVDGPERVGYPTDGIGRDVGDTLDELSFLTPAGESFTLGALHAAPGNKLLMLVTASGWCTACIEEQPKLQALHEEFECHGLALMVAVFQDEQFNEAEVRDAERWQTRFGLTFPVVADPPFVFGDYYDASQTPMVMMVNAETMEILSIETGYNEANVRAIINATL